MKTIVVAYDESEPAKHALERAAELAGAFESQVIVTSIAPVLAPAGRGLGGIDPVDPPERHEEQLAHARSFLESRGIQGKYVPGMGEPADIIVGVARERNADLIVTGKREAGFAERLLSGSVSESVARHARCDVLIVH